MSTKLRNGTAEEAGMSPERVRHVADLAQGWVEQGITPALVVLVARRGIVVIHEAFGRLGPEPGAPPLQRDSLFPLASISKPLTATAAMILVEDGLLGLNRPVQWYIPEFVGEGKDAVMVHHLLTHTLGLRDEDLDAHAERKKGTIEIPPLPETQHPLVHEYLYLRYDAPLWKAPGVEMSYCGFGYELLGEVVRRVSGQSLADFTRERIFAPLGMKDTCWSVPPTLKQRLVRRAENELFADGAAWCGKAPWACGGAYSTVLDMALFGQMFLNRGTYGAARLLSPPTVAAMTRDQTPGISSHYEGEYFPEAAWGLGWSIRASKKALRYGEPLQSPQVLCHGGAGGTLLWVDPTYELVGVYFSVLSRRGIPPDVRVAEELVNAIAGRSDLFVNAATAAVLS
jgi:CubicO group peptidase (beta-lactamase class C family)